MRTARSRLGQQRAQARAALRGVLASLLLDDGYAALCITNVLQICLLFLVGYGWAHHSGANPWRAGLTVALLGAGLVLVSVALGG